MGMMDMFSLPASARGMMAQQVAIANGYDDPTVLKLIELLAAGTFGKPTIITLPNVEHPEVLVTFKNGEEEVSLLVTHRQLPKKLVDGGPMP